MAGLILEGGSMRAGFVAGALMALMDKGLTSFDVAVSVPASMPTLAYFAASQRWCLEKIWREEIDSAKLVCYRNLPHISCMNEVGDFYSDSLSKSLTSISLVIGHFKELIF
jgi:hypothetical protein